MKMGIRKKPTEVSVSIVYKRNIGLKKKTTPCGSIHDALFQYHIYRILYGICLR